MVLTVKSSSVTNALYNNVFTIWAASVSMLAWLTWSPNRFTRPTFVRVFVDYFDGNFQRHGKRVFHEHYDLVRRLVPEETLLEYRVQDGWTPLCKFLGHEAPCATFPSGNDKKETDQRIKQLIHSEVRRLTKLSGSILGWFIFMYILIYNRPQLSTI